MSINTFKEGDRVIATEAGTITKFTDWYPDRTMNGSEEATVVKVVDKYLWLKADSGEKLCRLQDFMKLVTPREVSNYQIF